MIRISLCLFCLFTVSVYGSDEWDLGEEQSHSIGLRAGYGEDSSKGVDLAVALPLMSELNIDYLQTDFAVEEGKESFDRYQVIFSTDPLATWSVQLDYSYSGNSGSLVTRDSGLGIQYYPDNWLLKARFLSGDAEIFPSREAVDTGRVANRSQQMDRDAVELTWQYFQQNWMWSVSGIDYDYSRDININPDNLRAQLVLGASSLQQLFGLLDWYASVEAGYQRGDHLWRFGYADYALELSGDKGKSPYLSWDYQLNKSVSLGFLAALGLDQSEHYSEASLRFYF